MTYDYTYSDETTDDGIRIRIVADDCPENPRRMYDNAGVVAFHRNVDYDIGDETYGAQDYYTTDGAIRDYLDGVDVRVVIPLRLVDYGSSGAILRADDPIVGARACRAWLRSLDDESSDYNGVAYLDAATVREGWRTTRAGADYLRATVGELACYVRGDVYGYVVDVPGNHGLSDSCFGFYCEPDGYVREAAREAADAMLVDLEARREALTVRSVN